MKDYELNVREELLESLENYFGWLGQRLYPMDNLHKLSTFELILIARTVELTE